jgi:hypothetical protein
LPSNLCRPASARIAAGCTHSSLSTEQQSWCNHHTQSDYTARWIIQRQHDIPTSHPTGISSTITGGQSSIIYPSVVDTVERGARTASIMLFSGDEREPVLFCPSMSVQLQHDTKSALPQLYQGTISWQCHGMADSACKAGRQTRARKQGSPAVVTWLVAVALDTSTAPPTDVQLLRTARTSRHPVVTFHQGPTNRHPRSPPVGTRIVRPSRVICSRWIPQGDPSFDHLSQQAGAHLTGFDLPAGSYAKAAPFAGTGSSACARRRRGFTRFNRLNSARVRRTPLKTAAESRLGRW